VWQHLWETKNAKKWKAELAGQAPGGPAGSQGDAGRPGTEAMPPDVEHLTEIEGCGSAPVPVPRDWQRLSGRVWSGWPSSARPPTAKQGKVEQVYDYLNGRVPPARMGIVDPPGAAPGGLARNAAAMQAIWAPGGHGHRWVVHACWIPRQCACVNPV